MLFVSKAFSGRQQDFAILREVLADISLKKYTVHVDLGFLGIQKLGVSDQIFIPFKSSKNKPLTRWQRALNKVLAGERIAVENAIAKLKSFFVLRIENRMRKKDNLTECFELCAALANFKISSKC